MLRRVKFLFSVFTLSLDQDSACITSSYYAKVLLNSFTLSKIPTIMSVTKTPKGNFYTHLAHYFTQTVIG